MKTKLLIIVGVTVLGISIISETNNGHDLFHYMNLPYEWHNSFGFTDSNFIRSSQCAAEELGWFESCNDVRVISDNTQEQLKAILEYCIDSKDFVDTVGLSYYNDTHSIDTNTCEWKIIEKISVGNPIYERNRNELQQVLEWCDDTSDVKYGFYNYSNDTHSINTSTCKWKKHVTFSTNDSLCVPYVDKWIAGEDWSNKTHYFDTASCTWKDDPNYDAANSKGCPQFCPKEDLSLNEGLDDDLPETRSIVTVQDRPANRTIVPITITEKTTNAQSLDTVIQWNFSLLGIEMATLNDYWGNLADQYITTELVDQSGNDVVDYSRVPDGQIFYKLSLQYYPAICDDGKKLKGEAGYPEPIPIKSGTTEVFFKSGSMGLYPDDEGKYFFDFVSGFETDVEYHPNVKVISEETKKCQLEIKRGNFTDVYYTHAVFGFDD